MEEMIRLVAAHDRETMEVTPVTPPRGLAGSIRREGDLVSPIGNAWETER